MPTRPRVATKSPVKAQSVRAVFCPIGNVNVNLTTPGGNQYQIRCRQPFTIQPEDEDFFFINWDWKFRQRLFREDEVPADLHAYNDHKNEAKAAVPGVGTYGAKVSDDKPTPGLKPVATIEPKKAEPTPKPAPVDDEDKE